MIIINESLHTCFTIERTLKKIEADRSLLTAIITNEYLPRSCEQPNTFFLWWQVGEYDPSCAITIISPFHKMEFIVAAGVVQEIGIRTILGWLFDRSALSFSVIEQVGHHLWTDYTFWKHAEETVSFSTKHITTNDALIRERMIITSVLKDGLRQASAISGVHALRNQQYCLDIQEVTGNGIDGDRLLAHEKACSETRERNACGWIGGALSQDHMLPVQQDVVQLYCGTDLPNNDAWYPIIERGTQKQRAIPGQILFYPYLLGQHRKGNSNGVACHQTYEAAFENGLLELIERDSFVLRRLTKSGGKRVVPSESTKKLIDATTGGSCVLDLLVLEFGILPVVLAIAREGKKIIVAAGTGYTLDQAIHKACCETKQFLHHLWSDPTIDPQDSVIIKHIKHYVDETNFDAVAWIYQSLSVEQNEESKRWNLLTSVEDCEKKLTEQGIQLFVYQYHYPPLHAFSRVCLRVLSSHHLPIRFGNKTPLSIITAPRIRYWMEKLSISTLNTDVHPFG